MKDRLPVLVAALMLLLAACTTASSPGSVTSQQQTIANAVEDSISIGLVPVLAKNPGYIPLARGVAAALASFSGSTLSADDIHAFVSKTSLAHDDAVTVEALVSAAWNTYQRRYAVAVGASLRPDVGTFLKAAAQGIGNAVAAVPGGG